MLSALRRLFTAAARKVKVPGDQGFIIVDFTEETIRLPDGTLVWKRDIISVDAEKGIIIYRAPDGTIRTAPLPGGPADAFLRRVAGNNALHY